MAERRRVPWLALLAAVVVGGALAWALVRAQRPPDGPVAVAWDRTDCERCRMLLSDPHFAAQLHTADGRVLFFDDPGCLLLWEHEHDVEATGIWYHHVREDRWLSRERTVLVPAGPTPMGYGLGARDAARTDGLSHEEALVYVLARERERTGAPPAPPHGPEAHP